MIKTNKVNRMKKILILISLLFVTFGLLNAQQRKVSPALAELLNQKDSIVLNQKLTQLQNSNKEDSLSLLMSYYAATQNGVKYKAINKQSLEKFPNGLAAFNVAADEIYNETNGFENEKKYTDFIKRFGSNPQFKEDKFFESAKFFVASSFAKTNPTKTIEWIDLIQDTVYKTKAYSYGSRELFAAKQYAPAEILIKRALDDLKRRSLTESEDYFTYSKAYAATLFMNKKYDEGFIYAKKAYDYSNKKDKELNEIYLNLLIATRQFKEAYPLMEEGIKNGTAAFFVKEQLANAYLAVTGNTTGFKEYEASLYAAQKKKLITELSRQLVSEKAPDFSLKDVDGKTVTLESLKGKVVVLDFWATWCGPCKRSFPAMQMAVNKYKNDSDVKFLFIHTWEKDDNAILNAKKFILDNKYTFQVLMDTKDAVTGKNKVVTDYKISGIPAKFVIDANGKIRFKLTGFSGGNDAALAELSAMIEIAKNNK
jgi:peroxiredoxin